MSSVPPSVSPPPQCTSPVFLNQYRQLILMVSGVLLFQDFLGLQHRDGDDEYHLMHDEYETYAANIVELGAVCSPMTRERFVEECHKSIGDPLAATRRDANDRDEQARRRHAIYLRLWDTFFSDREALS